MAWSLSFWTFGKGLTQCCGYGLSFEVGLGMGYYCGVSLVIVSEGLGQHYGDSRM